MGNDRGIFDSMFGRDLLGEVDDVMDAVDQSLEDGYNGIDRRARVEEARQKRERHEERQRMLLLQRLIDELPETADYIRKGIVAHTKDAADRIVVQSAATAVLGTEMLAARFVGKVVEQVYRERMDRMETLSRLGRKRPVARTSSVSGPAAGPAGWSRSPEEEAVEDVFDQLMSKVHSVLHPLRMWVARKQAKQSGWLEEP